MFKVLLSGSAQEFYGAAPATLARRLARCFAQLENNPRQHNNIKRLSGELAGKSRFRVGDWRVLFRIDDAINTVFVLTIAHRREVYE